MLINALPVDTRACSGGTVMRRKVPKIKHANGAGHPYVDSSSLVFYGRDSDKAPFDTEFVVCVFTRNTFPDTHDDATLLSFGEVSRRMMRDQMQTPLQSQ